MKVIIDCCADEEYNPEFEFETFDKNAIKFIEIALKNGHQVILRP